MALLLCPLSWLFAALAALRRAAFRWGWLTTVVPPVPVVVVGNIAVGGSGKTPFVLWLVAQLRAAGMRPGIISRGHGGRRAGSVPQDGTPEDFGDEAVLMMQRSGCPVCVNADRPAAAKALVLDAPDVDVIVSDDGLQHYRLGRRVEVVIVDEAVLANRLMLPAGPLREPLGRLLGSDVLVVHGAMSADLARHLDGPPMCRMELIGNRLMPLVGGADEAQPVSAFVGRTVHAVAGIGRPERFFLQLEAMGLQVVRHPFPDHHRFSPDDLRFAPQGPVVMTEKDAVKCRDFEIPDCWVFPVEAQIEGDVVGLILEKLKHGSQIA